MPRAASRREDKQQVANAGNVKRDKERRRADEDDEEEEKEKGVWSVYDAQRRVNDEDNARLLLDDDVAIRSSRQLF